MKKSVKVIRVILFLLTLIAAILYSRHFNEHVSTKSYQIFITPALILALVTCIIFMAINVEAAVNTMADNKFFSAIIYGFYVSLAAGTVNFFFVTMSTSTPSGGDIMSWDDMVTTTGAVMVFAWIFTSLWRWGTLFIGYKNRVEIERSEAV